MFRAGAVSSQCHVCRAVKEVPSIVSQLNKEPEDACEVLDGHINRVLSLEEHVKYGHCLEPDLPEAEGYVLQSQPSSPKPGIAWAPWDRSGTEVQLGRLALSWGLQQWPWGPELTPADGSVCCVLVAGLKDCFFILFF